MRDRFEELLETEDQDRKAKLEVFFLEKPLMNSALPAKIRLKTASGSDRFKKDAEQADKSRLTQFFGTLSRSLKDKFLDRTIFLTRLIPIFFQLVFYFLTS